ncbi:MAG: LysE family translocator [Pseudomonadota bacterium]
MSAEFWLTALVVVLLPGTGVIYTLAVGLGSGGRASILAAVGCTLGIVPHILASIVGLAALLHASAVAFEIVRIAGVLYLLYMAVMVLKEGGALKVGAVTRESALRIVRRGILLNILNPKLSIFFLAFLPQFVPVEAGAATLSMLAHAGAFMGLTFVVFILYGLLAAAARTYVVERPVVMRWLSRTFAGAFALLSVRLAFAER